MFEAQAPATGNVAIATKTTDVDAKKNLEAVVSINITEASDKDVKVSGEEMLQAQRIAYQRFIAGLMAEQQIKSKQELRKREDDRWTQNLDNETIIRQQQTEIDRQRAEIEELK